MDLLPSRGQKKLLSARLICSLISLRYSPFLRRFLAAKWSVKHVFDEEQMRFSKRSRRVTDVVAKEREEANFCFSNLLILLDC